MVLTKLKINRRFYVRGTGGTITKLSYILDAADRVRPVGYVYKTDIGLSINWPTANRLYERT